MAGIQRIADSFGVTPRRVQQHAKDGMPKGARGDYDELACLRWYVKYLKDQMASGAVTDDGGMSGRERLAQAQAAMKEFELAEARKQILTVTDYERAMADLITPARLELLALEARLRPVIGAEASARCGMEIRRCLRGLALEEQTA